MRAPPAPTPAATNGSVALPFCQQIAMSTTNGHPQGDRPRCTRRARRRPSIVRLRCRSAGRPRQHPGATSELRQKSARRYVASACSRPVSSCSGRVVADTAVREICAEASLNTRYFYESFKSNEDLLFQVYERVVAEMSAAVIEETARAVTIEEQARAGLRAAWTLMAEDRRKARVIVVEVVGASERLERLRRRDRHVFADILVRNAMSLAEADVKLRFDPVLNARALMGASIELLGDWVNGELDASVDEIVDYLVHLYTRATYALLVDPPGDARPAARKRATPSTRSRRR